MPVFRRFAARSLLIAMSMGIVATSGCGGGTKKPADDDVREIDPQGSGPSIAPAPPQDPEAPSGDAAIANRVSMEQLNAAADPADRFGGKQVALTGKVVRPARIDGVVDAMVVMLNEDGDELSLLSANYVDVQFPRPGDDRLRTLAPAQTVTIRGRLENVTDNIWQLTGAELASVGEKSTLAVSANDLTRAFVDDEEAATEKYGKQPLEVTGTIAAGAAKFGKFLAVPLEGVDQAGKPTRVLVLLDPAHFWEYGTAPLDPNTLKEKNLFGIGDEATFYGTLQFTEFGDGPDGIPGLPLEGYPATWNE